MVSTSLMQGTDTRAIAYQALVDLSHVVPDAARLTYWSLSSSNEFVAQCSMSTAALHSIEGMRIPLEVNPDWLASLRAGETILVTDAESDTRVGAFGDMFRKAGTRALAVTPIARAGELLGGISVAASQPLPWSTDTVETLHALADVLAIGILRDRGDAEREAAAQALRHSEMRLRVVNAVTTSIAQGNPSASVAQMAIAAILNVIPDVRATWWLESEGRQLPMYSASSNETPALTDAVPLHWFEHAKTDDGEASAAPHVELCSSIGAKSLLLARMNKGRETFGWVSVDAPLARTWSAYEIGLLQEVASALALGISKERAERDRVKAEQALRASEQRFRDLASLSTDWYWEQDEEFRYTMLSGSVTGSTDEALSAYLGKRRWEIPIVRLTPEQWAEHRRTLEQHLPFQDLMLPYSRDDGTTGYNCVSGMPLFDENGKFKGYRGVVREVTQARRAEEELLRFRAAMETSGECIFLVDRQTLKYIDVNRTACDVLGYSRAQLLRMGPLDVEAGSGLDTIVCRYDDVFADNQPAGALVPHTMELLCADGSSMPVDVSLKAVHIGGREIVVAVCRDSRERLRYETQLERQANYDTLTGLSNRNLLHDQLGVAMEDSQAARPAARAVLRRPRQLQAGERQPRAQRRRPAAAARGHEHAAMPARRGHRRPIRRRRVRAYPHRAGQPADAGAHHPPCAGSDRPPDRDQWAGNLLHVQRRREPLSRSRQGLRDADAQRRHRHVRGEGAGPQLRARVPPRARPARAAAAVYGRAVAACAGA